MIRIFILGCGINEKFDAAAAAKIKEALTKAARELKIKDACITTLASEYELLGGKNRACVEIFPQNHPDALALCDYLVEHEKFFEVSLRTAPKTEEF